MQKPPKPLLSRRVGANIRAAREAKGWSQNELARQSKLHGVVSQTMISAIEQQADKHKSPSIDVIEILARTLDLPPEALLYSPQSMQNTIVRQIFQKPAPDGQLSPAWTAPKSKKSPKSSP